jgi:hypothetical protein
MGKKSQELSKRNAMKSEDQMKSSYFAYIEEKPANALKKGSRHYCPPCNYCCCCIPGRGLGKGIGLSIPCFGLHKALALCPCCCCCGCL